MKRILTILLLSFLTFNIFSKEIKTLKIKINELDKIEFMNCTSMDFINGYLIYDNSNENVYSVGFKLKDVGDKYTAHVGDWEDFIKNKNCEFKIIIFNDINVNYDVGYHITDDTLYITFNEL